MKKSLETILFDVECIVTFLSKAYFEIFVIYFLDLFIVICNYLYYNQWTYTSTIVFDQFYCTCDALDGILVIDSFFINFSHKMTFLYNGQYDIILFRKNYVAVSSRPRKKKIEFCQRWKAFNFYSTSKNKPMDILVKIRGLHLLSRPMFPFWTMTV